MLVQAIENLESRNAFQEDVIEQLNQELSVHQSEISELKQQLKLIAKRIQNNNNGAIDGVTVSILFSIVNAMVSSALHLGHVAPAIKRFFNFLLIFFN